MHSDQMYAVELYESYAVIVFFYQLMINKKEQIISKTKCLARKFPDFKKMTLMIYIYEHQTKKKTKPKTTAKGHVYNMNIIFSEIAYTVY